MCNFEGRERVTDEWISMAILSLARMEKVCLIVAPSPLFHCNCIYQSVGFSLKIP